MIYHIGIDPGKNGAVSVIHRDGTPIEVFDMPTRFLMPRKKREKRSKHLADGVTPRKKQAPIKQDLRSVLDAKTLHQKLLPYSDKIAICALEHVSSHTGQGVKSVFTFGESLGAIKGVLESLGINYFLVTPKTWQDEFGLAGLTKDKDIHKENIFKKSMEFYPDVSYHGPRGGLRDGRSDAMLICRYGLIHGPNGKWVGEPPFPTDR